MNIDHGCKNLSAGDFGGAGQSGQYAGNDLLIYQSW